MVTNILMVVFAIVSLAYSKLYFKDYLLLWTILMTCAILVVYGPWMP